MTLKIKSLNFSNLTSNFHYNVSFKTYIKKFHFFIENYHRTKNKIVYILDKLIYLKLLRNLAILEF
jgi:hypothetical protein